MHAALNSSMQPDRNCELTAAFDLQESGDSWEMSANVRRVDLEEDWIDKLSTAELEQTLLIEHNLDPAQFTPTFRRPTMTASSHHITAEEERLTRQALRDALRKAEAKVTMLAPIALMLGAPLTSNQMLPSTEQAAKAEVLRVTAEAERMRLLALEPTAEEKKAMRLKQMNSSLKAATKAAAWGAEAGLQIE